MKAYIKIKTLGYFVIFIVTASGSDCFSQWNDSIRFSVHTSPKESHWHDNYKNYLNTVHTFIIDYSYAQKKDSFKPDKRQNYIDSICVFSFGYDQIKRYTSIKAALMANPDSVIFLDLRNQDLKGFPMELLRFKNLKYLDISTVLRYEYVDSLSDKEREEWKMNGKLNPLDKGPVAYKSNNISKFPSEIAQLKKLVWLKMGPDICQEEYDRLKKYLPNCYIETGLYEYINNREADYGKEHCKEKRKRETQ